MEVQRRIPWALEPRSPRRDAGSSWCPSEGCDEAGSARVGEVANGIQLLRQEGEEVLLECCSQEQEADKKPKSADGKEQVPSSSSTLATSF